MAPARIRTAVLGTLGLALMLPASHADGDEAPVTAPASKPSPLGEVRGAQQGPSVTDLTARALSARAIALRFSAAGTGRAPVTRYVIRQSRTPITATNFDRARALCGGICSFSAERPGDRVRLTVEDLVPDRLYHYALRALDSAGRPGAISRVASARTGRDRTRPGAPTKLSVRALQRGRVRLRWRAPGSDGRGGPPVKRYIVKQSRRPITSPRRFERARSLCQSSCLFAPTRRGASLSLLVRGLCPGRRYHYAIRAKDEGGNVSGIGRFRIVRLKPRRGVTCT